MVKETHDAAMHNPSLRDELASMMHDKTVNGRRSHRSTTLIEAISTYRIMS